MAAPELLRRWEGMVEPWGAPRHDIDVAGRDLLERYAQPHRRYHTLEHLTEALVMLGDLVDLAPDPVGVEFAAWFHDGVYDPRAEASSNEAASADLAGATLGSLGVAEEVIISTRRLIMITADHVVAAGDVDAAVLADADLWILGAPQDRYRRYAADVRAEYGWLDDAGWQQGRSAFLAGLLHRPRIYATDRAHRALDRAARHNLTGELASLSRRQAQA